MFLADPMANPPPASLEVTDLTFRYPGANDPALAEVSFTIEPGQRVGLLGPNGAGKSTLMRLICGYLPLPTDGLSGPSAQIKVAGFDVYDDSLAVRQRVGYLPEQVPLYAELRVREHLDFRATVKRVPRRGRRIEVERVAELSGLQVMLDIPIHKLSRGYRQRVGIADALLGAPPLVVLDEPTVGLDPNQVQGIRTMLRELGGTQTLIFSSHILAEVDALCDRILILSRGRLVTDERVDDALAAHSLVVEWPDSRPLQVGEECLAAAWAAAGGSGEVPLEIIQVPGRFRARIMCTGSDGTPSFRGPELAQAIGTAALACGLPLSRLETGGRRLEERFATATGFIEGHD